MLVDMKRKSWNPAIPSSPAQAAKHYAKTAAKTIEARLNKHIVLPAMIGLSRLKRWSPRQPRFLGAFPDREAALAAVPRGCLDTYDHEDVAMEAFEWMCLIQVWDYPVKFWLEKLRRPGMKIIDAGGNFGCKYIGFSQNIKLDDLSWTVYELPETVRTARKLQHLGRVPEKVGFIDNLADAPQADLLIASGLLQYLDIPFAELVARLPNRPKHILLNKVATREGPAVTTLEKIGPARVPYQIRCHADFEAELASTGYLIADTWLIASLCHVIDTHPELGRSVSRGYLLQWPD